ncbi:MAG: ATP-binding protein [Synergistaceae bacterium]|nr:ATP-binding protein [Synergistaceae bacterium]
MDMNITNDDDVQSMVSRLLRENRKLSREIVHLKNAVAQEKIAYTTVLNQQKASTFIQRERERYLALLLANSPSIILFLSQTMRVEFCTEYFVAKAGFKKAVDVLGHTLTEIFSPFLDIASHENMLEQSRLVIETNTPRSLDMTFHFNRSGEAEDFSGLIVPMKDERQHSDGVMLLFHDITDIKRSREEALSASKAKSDFLSNMSHEIRTPMNAIIGMTAIGKSAAETDRKDYCLKRIEGASHHLLGIINDILDMSKIEANKFELSVAEYDFENMLRRVVNVISFRVDEKQQSLTVNIDSAIPKTIIGDDQRLAQVITNLISNAVKFTPDGGAVRLNTFLASEESGVCIIQVEVTDTGIGISPQQQKRLFKSFQQAESSTTREFGGTGLGLAISKSIVEMMSGKIWVESELGKGATFAFTFQAKRGNEKSPNLYEHINLGDARILAADDDLNVQEAEHGDTSIDFHGISILLAEDMEINREIVLALLEPMSLNIDCAKNGAEAVNIFSEAPEKYKMIFMDVQMPEMDGYEATRHIRALDIPSAKSIPIVAMTANVFKEDIKKCIEAGMNDHIGKPLNFDEVEEKLRKYLREIL